jgi:hypothetical protein
VLFRHWADQLAKKCLKSTGGSTGLAAMRFSKKDVIHIYSVETGNDFLFDAQ